MRAAQPSPPRVLPRRPQLAPFLPLLDPDHFHDAEFFRGLDSLGIRQVLLGGTGSAHLRDVVRMVRESTDLEVVLYPAGPDSVCEADLIVLPDIMNSVASHARPFGPVAVTTALAAAATGKPCLPVAHFIVGRSTASWYFEAEPVAPRALLASCQYAAIVGYRHIALDYEDPSLEFDPRLAKQIKQRAPSVHLTVSDEVTPAGAAELRRSGVDTVIVPSDCFEQAQDPLGLLREYSQSLLAA